MNIRVNACYMYIFMVTHIMVHITQSRTRSLDWNMRRSNGSADEAPAIWVVGIQRWCWEQLFRAFRQWCVRVDWSWKSCLFRIHENTYLSVFLFFCLSVCLSFYLSVFLSFCLSVFLSVCLFLKTCYQPICNATPRSTSKVCLQWKRDMFR